MPFAQPYATANTIAIATCACTSARLASANTSRMSVAPPTMIEDHRRPNVSSATRPANCIGPISDATNTADAAPRPLECNRFTTCTEMADVMNAVSANDAESAANTPLALGFRCDGSSWPLGAPAWRRATPAGMHARCSGKQMNSSAIAKPISVPRQPTCARPNNDSGKKTVLARPPRSVRPLTELRNDVPVCWLNVAKAASYSVIARAIPANAQAKTNAPIDDANDNASSEAAAPKEPHARIGRPPMRSISLPTYGPIAPDTTRLKEKAPKTTVLDASRSTPIGPPRTAME